LKNIKQNQLLIYWVTSIIKNNINENYWLSKNILTKSIIDRFSLITNFKPIPIREDPVNRSFDKVRETSLLGENE